MVKFRATERDRGVARLTPLRCLKMLRRLDHIGFGQTGAAHVATGAIPRRSLEYTIDVAGLATGVGMYPGQRKPCLYVVEVSRVRL